MPKIFWTAECCVNTWRSSSILFHYIPRKAELGILLFIYQRRRPSGLSLFFFLLHCTLSAAAASIAAAAAVRILGTLCLLWSLPGEKKSRGELGGIKGQLNAYIDFLFSHKLSRFYLTLLLSRSAVIFYFGKARIRPKKRGKKKEVVHQRSAHYGRVVGWKTVEVWEWVLLGGGVQGDTSTVNLAATSNGEPSGDDGKTLRLP